MAQRPSEYENIELISWLTANIKEDRTGKISFKDIRSKMGKSISPVGLGRLMVKLYPEVKSKQERLKSEWNKRESVFHGVTWKVEDNACPFEFLDILKYTETCFLIHKTHEEITVGMFTGDILNGNRLIAEIKFRIDLKWSVSVCGKTIDLEKIGLTNKFLITKGSIHGIIDTVKKFRYCKGIQDSENVALNEQDFVKEVWTKSGNENYCISLVRSRNCIVALNYIALHTTCLKCLKLVKHNKIVATDHLLKNKEKENEFDQPNNSSKEGPENEIILSQNDHEDFSAILQKVIPDCPERLKTFLTTQRDAVLRKSTGRRWNKEIIRLCLTLWCRSPRGYVDVRSSGFVVLPSTRILQYYKNAVNQTSGFNKDMFHWMLNEAKNRNLSPEGYEGGLLIDEMTIQQDIQFSKKGGTLKLIGFKDFTEESKHMNILMNHKKNVSLATHVLQFLFLGMTGFRFPFTYFATTGASASELYLVFWKAVNYLAMFGFSVTFLSMDGAQSNRDFMNILLAHTGSGTFTIDNIYDPKRSKISIIMDFSHVMKKIRNNISKSGKNKYDKRNLTHKENKIYWEHRRNAYLWDISTNPFPIHKKFTHEHFFLTSESKMRNHLAEDVLDSEMLHLMRKYKEGLSEERGSELNSSIELLESTSILIKIFRDPRPISDSSDVRLKENETVLHWFCSWESEVKESSVKNPDKFLISHQTRQDISSLVTGFNEFCQHKFTRSDSSIIPSRVNSDVIENLFCQERSLHNGANTNPTFLGYCRTINSIILGQSTISRKSNAGNCSAEPYKFSLPDSVIPKKKSKQ